MTMRLEDLLRVLREEFAIAADDVDAALMAWLGGEPEAAQVQAEAIRTQLDRLAQATRVLALEGHAVALEQLRDSALALALSDPEVMGEGLGWMMAWRPPFAACFDQPGHVQASQALLDHLRQGPLAPDAELLGALGELLMRAPVLEADAPDPADSAASTPFDVSLDLPDDVDAGLLEAFLADAPDQLARLGDAVRALARGAQPIESLIEAQRVAHTFKGSGNIIGIRGVGQMAHRIEDLIEFAVAEGGALPPAMGRDLEQATAALDQMVYALRGEETPPLDALERLECLKAWTLAIRDGSWREKAGDSAPAPAAATAVPNARPEAPSEAEAQVRVGVGRLERLMRRAGQGLVHHGRVDEQLRQIDERLVALQATQRVLQERLRELAAQIDRQGVNLREKADAEGAAFDPLEMDRYGELHTLARFIAESAADAEDLAAGARQVAAETGATLRDQKTALAEQHRELIGARLVPFRQIAARLRRNVSQTAASTGKRARLEIEGEQVQLDHDVLERLTEPLLHLLRNAVDHGIESIDDRSLLGKDPEGCVQLRVSRDGQTVRIECGDDGRGLDLAAIHAKASGLGLIAAGAEIDEAALSRLILLPGFSTREEVSDVSGRGVGMDVVAERIRSLKGHVDIASEPFVGTTITLRVPASAGTAHALIVDAGGTRVALPTESVRFALAAGVGELVDGRLVHGEESWRCMPLAAGLGLPDTANAPPQRPCVVVRGAGEEVAFVVDHVVDARELILQDVGRLLRRVRGIGGGALRTDGRVVFLLDADSLEQSSGRIDASAAAALRRRMTVTRKRALVVDDAHSVRKTMQQLLGDAGYEVRTARDGFDALDVLARGEVDIVLTDLEMPNLNGLELTRRLRESAQWEQLPVIMITSRSTEKHRESAQAVGVNRYLTKPYTDGELLERVRELLAA